MCIIRGKRRKTNIIENTISRNIRKDLKETLNRFIKTKEKQGLTKHTIKIYTNSLFTFFDFLNANDIKIKDVDAHIVLKYLKIIKEEYNYCSYKVKKSSVKALYNHLYYMGNVKNEWFEEEK